MNSYLKKFGPGGKTEDPIKDILNFGFALPKNEPPIGLGNNPYQQTPTYAYNWGNPKATPTAVHIPSGVYNTPQEIENRKKAELAQIVKTEQEKEKIRQNEYGPGYQIAQVPTDNTYTGVNPNMSTMGNVPNMTSEEGFKRNKMMEEYRKEAFWDAIAAGDKAIGQYLFQPAAELFNTPFAAVAEGVNAVQGKEYDFGKVLPNPTRMALNAEGMGDMIPQQQFLSDYLGVDRKENPYLALGLDIFTPGPAMVTKPLQALTGIGKASTGAIQYASKMNTLERAIDNPIAFAKKDLNPFYVNNVNPNIGFKFADQSIDAQKALREAEELALKQKQPVSYNKPELKKKYFQEYDYGISQSEDTIKPIQKDIEELKNAYRTEFEKQWGKEYNEKDLLSYAKIREGIDPSSTTKFADQDFVDINNQFITDFDVKNIDDIGQANALSDYTSGRYYGFNQNATRGGHNLPFYREFMNPFLDDALNQNVLTKDIELHRGFGTDIFTVVRDGKVIENVPKSKILPGDVITTGNRYQSTSLIKNPHFDYQEKLIVPKGTSFGYANKQGLSYVPAELELTLPRNTMYKALDDGSFKVIKDQGQGILPESAMSTVAKASDDVTAQMPNAKEIEQITTYKNDLLNRLKTTEEGKRRLENLGLTPEDLNDIDLDFNAGGSRAMAGRIDYTGNPYVNINLKQIKENADLGLTPMNTAAHEIAHALQYLAAKKRYNAGVNPTDFRYNWKDLNKTPADQEMLDWLTKNADRSKEPFPGYFDEFPGIDKSLLKENPKSGMSYVTERAEPYAHLREFRANMMDEGILKNEWDNVTEDMVDKFMKTSSTDRMKGFMQNTPDFRKRMSMLLNKYPAVVPGILGTGAATYGVNKSNQQIPQNRYGGQNPYITPKYKYGGPIDPVNPEEENKMMQRQINSIISGKPMNTGITMTKLNPDEEYTYQQWAKGLTPNLQGSMDDKNYDMRGAWKVGEQPELFYYDNNEFMSAHPIDVNQQGSIYEPHLFSRNPFTGKSLKGPNHETFMHALEGDIKAGGKVKMDLKTGDMYTYEKGGDTEHSTVEIERSERVYTPDGKLIMETPADAPTHEDGGVKVTLPAGSLVFPKKYYKALDAASGLPAFKKIAKTMLDNAEKAYLRGEPYSSGGKRQ